MRPCWSTVPDARARAAAAAAVRAPGLTRHPAAWRVAVPAHRRALLDPRVGGSDQPQRRAAATQLPARLLPTLLAQALRLPPEPIAGGRLAAVAAVLGQPRRQLLHLGGQGLHPLPRGSILGFPFGTIPASSVMPLGYTCCASPSDPLPAKMICPPKKDRASSSDLLLTGHMPLHLLRCLYAT